MSIITSMRKQTAVYWPLGSEDSGGSDWDSYGKPLYATPVQISCRWEDVAKEFIGKQGTTEISKSIVYVDRDVRVGGVLLLSLLANVSDLTTPKNNDGAWEIRRFDKLPNLRNTESLRTAYL